MRDSVGRIICDKKQGALRMRCYHVLFRIFLILCLLGGSTTSYADAKDKALDDKHRVKTLEEVEEKAKQLLDKKKSKDPFLCHRLNEVLKNFPEETPLREAIVKALEGVNCDSDEAVYQKIKSVLLQFPDQKDNALYKAIRNALRQYKPLLPKLSLMPCQVTPTIEPSIVSKKPIHKNGNLLRKEGAVKRAMGQYMQLKGKVVDEQCTPIANAVIEIWQADNAGNYEDEYDLTSPWDVKDPNYDKNFAYSGTVQSNNVGEFSLLTILPGINENRKEEAPHLNIRVVHPDFSELQTRIYFDKHPKNIEDASLAKLSDSQRKNVTAIGKAIDPTHKLEGRIFYHRLVMQGIDPHREY